MNAVLKTTLAFAGLAMAGHAAAQITFYENEGFEGRSFTTDRQVNNLQRSGFNDRASSAVVRSNRWEVCDDIRFGGRCVVLRRGQYPSLAAMGLNDRVSSVRTVNRDARVGDERYAPPPPVAAVESGQITFYERDNYQGRSFTADKEVVDFRRFGFNDLASSAVVRGERWEVCDSVQFGGRCVVLRQGQYPSLAAMGLNDRISSVRTVNRNARIGDERYAPPVAAVDTGQITFYESDNFQGRTFTTDKEVDDFRRFGFSDLASSAVVRGERWEVCDNVQFGGRCVILRQGQYPTLAAMGLNDRVSSVRTADAAASVDERRHAPPPSPAYDYRRRGNERLFEANVTSVRAVVAAAEQRCWVEREQVVQDRGNANVGGAVVGAVIGGILGHQVGGGSGRDAATAVGVFTGAAIGANANRDRGGPQGAAQNVQRCTSVPSQARPEYWDVTYTFRGQEYRVQMTSQPGATVTVNEQGEPRA